MKFALMLAVLFVAISCVNSYKILFLLAFASKSHRNAFDPVVIELVKRGHEVTILSSVAGSKEINGATDILLIENARWFENSNWSFFMDKTNAVGSILGNLKNVCNLTYQDPEVTKMLKNPSAYNFDVMIVNAIMNDFALPLGHHLGSANIIFSPALRPGSLAWDMNIPHPISYIPSGIDDSTDRMSFWQRIKNSVIQVGFHFIKSNFLFPIFDEIISEYIPNSPTIAELEKKVSFLITNTHPATNHPMPSMPYAIEIGCVQCQPAKPLPKDLEDFMQSSGDAGVIYFSLGSVTKGNSMPLEMRAKVIQAFAQLPQRILWKYEADIENLPNNIKLIKWAPQQDLLEHDKLRLFITHGGGLSTQEAVYHRCPVLGFPLSADQWGNMANAKQRGFAEFLNWKTFTVEEFLEKINLLITHESYQKASDHYSAILKDQPQPPSEKAAYWIEYVARHKGATHLKSAAEHLNFFQYFLLDVIGAILLIVMIVLAMVYFILRKICRMCIRKQSTETKKGRPTNKNKMKKN